MKPRVSDLAAILFAIIGFTCWVLGDTCVKWIAQFGFPAYEIVGFMGFFMALTLAIHAVLRRDLRSLRPHSLPRQLLRSMLDMANNVCVVIALRHLSLTMFYVLVFLSPLTIAVLSRIFLRERVGSMKATALVIGFAGVIIAVAPWSHQQRIDLIGVIACMVCVACFSVNMVWSRVLTRTEPPESLAFFSGVVTAAAGFALCGFRAQPLTPSLTAILVCMGAFCACGTLCFYIAVKHTSAGNVAPYHYTQLITGTFVSWLVWHDRPSLNVVLGGALILGSGVLIALLARSAQSDHQPVSLHT
ncbi:MAG: DMT family transporter [Terracidiphilus sp.]|nr:DMT family transporter [Terracidiphilus sp.]